MGRESFDSYFQRVARRGHAYPPPELYTPIGMEQLASAWADLAAQQPAAPVGVYVHLPFCERKCTFCYCDTIVGADEQRMAQYLQALHQEIRLSAPMLKGLSVSTVYLGGGTPTWLQPEQLDGVFAALKSHFSCHQDVHWNVESTPGSLTDEMAAVFEKHGVSRVTLGIQALDEQILASVNRPQSLDEVAIAVQRLRRAKVKWINFDLVAGLPNDSAERFRSGFSALLDLGPDMVHTYPYVPRPGHRPNPEKDTIIEVARAMMTARGLRSLPNDGWGRELASRNQQVIDKTERGGSCMGLGIRARSHVFSRLAYSSQSTADWQHRLLAGDAPRYRGISLSRPLQIQRYLMDNLSVGVSSSVFASLFGVGLHTYLQARHPWLLEVVETHNGRVRFCGAESARRDLGLRLFEPVLRDRLYNKYIGQPRGWPAEEVARHTSEDGPEMDANWMHFLAIKLSKGNTYPPGKGQVVTDDMVHDAWRDLSQRIRRGEALEAVGLYTHVPYCASICRFCYCYKHLVEKKETLERYTTALIHQMNRLSPAVEGIRLNSAYFGGGTPSVLSESQLDRLLGTMRDRFAFTEDHQFNFEGTPRTLAAGDRLAILAKHGVTRLTVGIQSLERGLLDDMNRLQPDARAVQAVITRARALGIAHINTDLMVGLPNQTLQQAQASAAVVIGWRPDVIHIYPFQPTAETRYFQDGFRVTDAAAARREQMLQVCRKMVADAGYREVPHESWSLSLAARNRQDVEKIVHAASVLPLGYLARGHVFGRLAYGSTEDGYRRYMSDPTQVDFYWGHPLELEDDMVRYLISNLREGIDRVAFHRIFGEDPLKRFWRVFLWMHQRGLVKVKRGLIESRMTSSHQSVVFAKALFHRRHHDALRVEYAESYVPETDYQAQYRSLYAKTF